MYYPNIILLHEIDIKRSNSDGSITQLTKCLLLLVITLYSNVGNVFLCGMYI